MTQAADYIRPRIILAMRRLDRANVDRSEPAYQGLLGLLVTLDTLGDCGIAPEPGLGGLLDGDVGQAGR